MSVDYMTCKISVSMIPCINSLQGACIGDYIGQYYRGY